MVYVLITCENGKPIKAEIKFDKPTPNKNQVVLCATMPKESYEQLSLFDNFEEVPGQIPGQLSMFEEIGG